MREIREISEQELEAYITISANAYPGIELLEPANRSRFRARLAAMSEDDTVHLCGIFEGKKMRGVMRWHDFTMNFFGSQALVGGLGGLAVDLLHKKEALAADMVRAFHQHYLKAGASLAALYPFRPDFYRRMGYGYGAPRYSYRFRPASLPSKAPKKDVVLLGKRDQRHLESCYEQYYSRTHGMMVRPSSVWRLMMDNPATLIAGVKREGRLRGYLIFQFQKGSGDNFLSNDIFVRELVYETAEDLGQLLTFLHSQADQVESIIFNTFDESFFFLLSDPRNGTGRLLPQIVYHEASTQGVGMMYRVISVPRLFDVLMDHDFGGQTCTVSLNVADSFLPENSGTYTLEMHSGRARLAHNARAEISLSMDIAEFSSLITGAISLRSLVDGGLATLSDLAYIDRLDNAFRGPKPVCYTSF